MDLSIIIPVYNTPPETLRRCLDALCFPEAISFEVILVDDGSREETASFCRSYAAAHPGVHCFRQENQGVSAARNAGISVSSGRYVMFVDADDELLPQVIQPEHLNGDWDMVFYDHLVCQGSKARLSRVFENLNPTRQDFLRAACQERVNAAWAKLFRRELLLEQKICFPRDMVVAEDAAFVLRAMMAAQTMTYVPEPIYRYHHSSDNGDSRLLRFPRAVFDNNIAIYHMRNDALTCWERAGEFSQEETESLRALAAERLVRILFENRGTLLAKGQPFPEILPTLLPLMEQVYQTWGGAFSAMARLKCRLLKDNKTKSIKFYALLRQTYIRAKSR